MSTIIRIATTDEQSVIQNMDQLYLYEFSRFMPVYYQLGDDGLFHDEDYGPYWDEPDKYPYLILHNEEKAGFALVEDMGDECLLAQFFVLYKFQGQGVAKAAALELFGMHVGCWLVQSLRVNPKSEVFWPKVIDECSGGRYTKGLQEPRQTHHVYRFSSG